MEVFNPFFLLPTLLEGDVITPSLHSRFITDLFISVLDSCPPAFLSLSGLPLSFPSLSSFSARSVGINKPHPQLTLLTDILTICVCVCVFKICRFMCILVCACVYVHQVCSGARGGQNVGSMNYSYRWVLATQCGFLELNPGPWKEQ